jgi:hypothetical protein
MEPPHMVIRSERNEFVLRLAVKLSVCGHLVFTVILPLWAGDRTAKVWPASQFFGAPAVCIVAAVIAITVMAAQWLRCLRIVGGISYMAFCLTYGCLVSEWRITLFAWFMSVCGLALALTGVPEND